MQYTYIIYSFLILLILITVLYIAYKAYNIYKSRQNENNIYFMNTEETKQFLLRDKDHYVNNLSKYDIYARQVKTNKEYSDNISKAAANFTNEEIARLIKCSHDADVFFKELSIKKYKEIKGSDIAAIKWIYAITDNNKYEEGLPHTRMNIIFLSKNIFKNTDSDLTNTIIHEKIHIYQRFNSDLLNRILASMNYSIVDRNLLENNHLIRSNPDVNNNIYIDNNTKKYFICLYRNEKPSSINDVIINNYSIEHPYEMIAYDIANHHNDISKYINI
jgi:hypothetical protein